MPQPSELRSSNAQPNGQRAVQLSHARPRLNREITGTGASKAVLPPNGSRLSCGALVKESSFNILRAPPASSAC